MTSRFLVVACVALATVWYPVASSDLADINPDSLDKAGAHVCVSQIQEAYTETEYYLADVAKTTHTWCWNVPPRCTKHFFVKEGRYRIVTKYRTRDKVLCCNGYTPVPLGTYCKPKCLHDCYNEEGQGYCPFPDTCLCYEGFKGEYCESGCGEGEWGPDCTRSCDCGSHGSCDPQNGNCICHIGWTGPSCDQMCENSFGMHCVHSCVCENNAVCNNVNGRCTCQPGYYGAYCHKECDFTSTTEDTCNQTCPCQNDGMCDADNNCVCKPGFHGEYCTLACDDRHWGQDCANECSCYNGHCDSVTGECTCYYGYGNANCNYQCEDGYYGTLCATECPCQNSGTCYFATNGEVKCNCTGTGYHGIRCTQRDCPLDQYLMNGECADCSCPWITTDSCNPLTGQCECAVGYTGTTCDSKCSMPYWGQDCMETCECAHGDCHYQSGNCTQCYAGYTGTNCDEKCPHGKWGLNCANPCGCLNNAYCHETSGFCECTAGYQGLFCDVPCEKTKWGKFCNNSCTCQLDTSICNPYTGECQCKPGFYGDNCENKCSAWKYGFHCRHECLCDRTGSESCNHTNGECVCAAGYKGVNCNSRCDDTQWGPSCQKSCDCNLQGSCDQSNGACICYPGYRGDKCEDVCQNGTYGYNCSSECPTCTGVSYCHHISGECVSDQCEAGLTGKGCDLPCPSGTWGLNCSNTCSMTCTRNGICSPVNGYCFCFPGYSGTECEEECRQWKYGTGCAQDCNCVKANTQSCSVSRGRCFCKPGYEGQECERRCNTSHWGLNCQQKCSDLCSPVYSAGCDAEKGLPCDCVDGYEPPTCTDQTSINTSGGQQGDDSVTKVSTPIIVVIVIAGLLLVAIIALLVIFYNRRIRKLKAENMSIRYAPNGTIPGETAIPNGRPLGLVNPTYADENLNNERRYPHLSQRRPLPEPSRRCSSESFDSIAEEKRQTRPESSHYHELDDDRYTTLRSVSGAPGAEGGGFARQGHNPRSRSPQRSYRGSGDYGNRGFGYDDETDLKKNNLDLAAAFRPSTDPNSSVATEPSNRSSNPYETPKQTGLPKVQNYDNTVPKTSVNSTLPYDLPSTAPPENVRSNTNGGYITPQNDINESNSNKDASRTPTENKEPRNTLNGGYLTPQNDMNDPQVNSSSSDTLPFDTMEATTSDPETSQTLNNVPQDWTTFESPAPEPERSPVENDNSIGWIAFEAGSTETADSPYTNA